MYKYFRGSIYPGELSLKKNTQMKIFTDKNK